MVLGNNRGQAFFYTLMLGTVLVVLALALTPVVRQFVDTARSPTTNETVGLDCGNSTISDFNKAQCLITDVATPYFFYGILSIAGIVVGAKLILGGSGVTE